jgi:hypothetical protein
MLPVVGSVVIEKFSIFLDVFVFESVCIVVSSVVLTVPDLSDSVACVDIVVVCFVVIGASQTIR